MKRKAIKKEMRQYNKILSVGYCNMQYLLKYYKPFAYSSDIYGWSCDYYLINDILISTGYRPIGNKNMKSNYELISEYDKKARELKNKDEIDILLFELLNKLEVVWNGRTNKSTKI